MSVYEFGNQFTFTNVPPGGAREMGGLTTPSTIISDFPYAASQLSHTDQRTPILWDNLVEVGDVEEHISPGFRYLDDAMVLYWSDIRIPTRDGYRFMRSRMAGGNKSLLVWTDDLKHGRAKLPVMSLNRTTHEYDVNKFSPPYIPLTRKHLDRDKTVIRLTYRPVPYLVNYSLNIWTEHRRDAEYALQQILPRFNPLIEFIASDGQNSKAVQLRYGGCTDESDKETSADQIAKIKYTITCTAEAWLSLPDVVMPAIVGNVGHVSYSDSDYSITREPFNRFRIGDVVYVER